MTADTQDTDSSGWGTDVDGFKQAIEADEYAELTLETGDVLITDWEGDGYFLPYLLIDGDLKESEPSDDRQEKAVMAIERALDAEVVDYEWSPSNNVLYPYFQERPTDD